MDRSHLFLAKLDDLKHLTTTDITDYSMIRASAIMRQFFLDSAPLVNAVNRDIRMPLTFRVSAAQASDTLNVAGIEEPLGQFVNVDPFDRETVEHVKMQPFLARPTVRIENHVYTVRNVIKCVAHVSGGVHAFDPEDEHEERLLAFDSMLTISQVSTLHHALLGASRVAVRGLHDLAGAVRAR